MRKYKIVRCRLRDIILSRGYTQASFAAKLNFSETYMSDICKGRSNLTLKNAMTISKALGVMIEDLYEWEKEKA
jgi:transcriptional regulator with XRE-family HTH domain